MNKITKIIIIVSSVLLIVGISLFLYVRADLYKPMSSESSKKVFEIEEGQGVKEIVANLQEDGFARNDLTIFFYLKLKKYDTKLKAGTYLLDLVNSPVETIDVLVSGDTAMQKITILEGWTKVDIANYLDEKGIATKDDFFMSITKSWDYDFAKNLADLEGYLYPDTYFIPYNSSAEDIVKIMLDNFDSKVTQDLKDEIEKQEKSLFDVITLASIVEKEVFGEEDRKIVAGVFWNRIKEGMPLQSDATVNYVTGSDNPQPTYNETRTASPYNTYLNRGLPIGPIGNPSIESILAVIHYTDTEFRYYLNRQDTGETIFSKTYEEHLANKEKYLN